MRGESRTDCPLIVCLSGPWLCQLFPVSGPAAHFLGAARPTGSSPAEPLQLTLYQIPPVECLLCSLPAAVIAQAPGSLRVELQLPLQLGCVFPSDAHAPLLQLCSLPLAALHDVLVLLGHFWGHRPPRLPEGQDLPLQTLLVKGQHTEAMQGPG